MMMAGNLPEEEKREAEGLAKEEREVVTSERLVLLQRPGRERGGRNNPPMLDSEIREIEALA